MTHNKSISQTSRRLGVGLILLGLVASCAIGFSARADSQVASVNYKNTITVTTNSSNSLNIPACTRALVSSPASGFGGTVTVKFLAQGAVSGAATALNYMTLVGGSGSTFTPNSAATYYYALPGAGQLQFIGQNASSGTSTLQVQCDNSTQMFAATVGVSPAPGTTPLPAATFGVVQQAACVAAYPCGQPTPIPRQVSTSGNVISSNTTVAIFTAAQLSGMNSCTVLVSSNGTGTVTAQVVDSYTNNALSSTVAVTANQTFAINAFPALYNSFNLGVGADIALQGISLTTTNYVSGTSNITWAAYCSTSNAPVSAINMTPFVAAATSTLTQFIAAPANGAIHFFSISGAGYDTATGGIVELEYGTGTNCGTGTTIMAYLFVMPAALTQGGGDDFSYGNGLASVIAAPVGKAVCVIATGTVGVAGIEGVYAIY